MAIGVSIFSRPNASPPYIRCSAKVPSSLTDKDVTSFTIDAPSNTPNLAAKAFERLVAGSKIKVVGEDDSAGFSIKETSVSA
ncbi:Uncharacterised protein [Yersinia massiliensis]|nr:Uncharacterised protein [Yersinia massiliensis]